MNICIISPRFYPFIGGNEKYLLDFVKYCSKEFKITVITSNIISIPEGILVKYKVIKKRYSKIFNNVEIIRVNTLRNFLLRYLFFFNQFINKKLEIMLYKIQNSHFFKAIFKKKSKLKLLKTITQFFIYQRCLTNPNFFQIYYALKKFHEKNKISLIHSSTIYHTSNIFAFLFSRKYNIPFICTPLFHINPIGNNILYPSFQYILMKSDAVIACTQLEKNYYYQIGLNQNKIHVIPPGIDPKKYNYSEVSNFKKKFNISEDSQLLLFMGRRTFEKGLINAIYSLNFINTTYKNIKLMIAGPYTKDYSISFKKIPANLKDNIIDLGLVDEPTKIAALACCDIFILPSLADAFGIVYLEAWLFKKPVIGAFGGNVEGLIEHNVDGVLVPFKNVKKLANSIDILLQDKSKREELGYNGYQKLMSKYTLNITNKNLLNLYKKLI